MSAITVLSTVATLAIWSQPAPGNAATDFQCATPLPTTTDAQGATHERFALPNGIVTDQIVPAGSTRRGAPCLRPGIRAGLPQIPSWYSGWSANAASGKAYSGVHASFTAPSYYLSTCSAETMAQWVGVSNDTDLLIQAGVYFDQWTGTVKSGAFAEIVGGPWDMPLVDLSAFVPYVAGHRYYFDVHYVDRYDWHFTIQDLDAPSNIYDANWYRSAAGGTTYIQPIAYAISERLSKQTEDSHKVTHNWVTQYMNHSTVSFRNTNAHIYGETDARFSIQRPASWTIYDRFGTSLSPVGALDPSTSNFTESWSSCGTQDET